MAIRKEVELAWNGESCSVLVTMGVIERIEEHLNLAKVAYDLSQGDVKMSHAARLVATLLNEGGINVQVDDVYEGMFTGESSDTQAVFSMMSDIVGAVFPEPKKKCSTSSKSKSPD